MTSQSATAVEKLRQKTLQDDLFSAPEISAWADDACLKRYLRARDEDVDNAMAMLRATAEWRSKNAIHSWLPARSAPVWPVLESESATGKMFVLPSVNEDGRAIIVMRPGHENNLIDPSKNLTYLAYTLERAAAHSAAAGGDGRCVVITDYAAGDFSLRRAPSLSTTKETLSIIQNHYPERLAAVFLCDSPSFFYPIFRMVKPFIDPVTAAKVHWIKKGRTAQANEACSEHLTSSVTPVEYGGALNYSFSANSYFEEL